MPSHPTSTVPVPPLARINPTATASRDRIKEDPEGRVRPSFLRSLDPKPPRHTLPLRRCVDVDDPRFLFPIGRGRGCGGCRWTRLRRLGSVWRHSVTSTGPSWRPTVTATRPSWRPTVTSTGLSWRHTVTSTTETLTRSVCPPAHWFIAPSNDRVSLFDHVEQPRVRHYRRYCALLRSPPLGRLVVN